MVRKSKGFSLDDAVFKEKMRKLARQHNIDEGAFVREQGALLSRDFARMTPPYERFPKASGASGAGYVGTARDKKTGENAILDDLHSIFRIKDQSFIEFCVKNFGVGSTNRAMNGKNGREYRIEYNRICLSLGEMAQWHSSQQNSRGRVRWRRASIETAWVSEKLFKKYYAAEKKKVGIAKASFIRAALALNPKVKAPAWVMRHISRASGSGKLAKIKNSPTAFIRASAAGIQHVLRPDIMRRVKNGRMKAMENRLKFLFKANAKKAGFKVR